MTVIANLYQKQFSVSSLTDNDDDADDAADAADIFCKVYFKIKQTSSFHRNR